MKTKIVAVDSSQDSELAPIIHLGLQSLFDQVKAELNRITIDHTMFFYRAYIIGLSQNLIDVGINLGDDVIPVNQIPDDAKMAVPDVYTSAANMIAETDVAELLANILSETVSKQSAGNLHLSTLQLIEDRRQHYAELLKLILIKVLAVQAAKVAGDPYGSKLAAQALNEALPQGLRPETYSIFFSPDKVQSQTIRALRECLKSYVVEVYPELSDMV